MGSQGQGQESDIHEQLRHAAIEGKLDRVKELLKEGADVNQWNAHKNTPLHLATFYGHASIVESLLQHGVKLDFMNMNGQSALQLAAVKGHLKIVKMLTKAGSALNQTTDYSGMTALHFASKEGQADICQHLLDVGAEEEAKDMINKIAESYAANHPTELVFKKWRQKTGGKSPTKTESKPAVKNINTEIKQGKQPTKPALRNINGEIKEEKKPTKPAVKNVNAEIKKEKQESKDESANVGIKDTPPAVSVAISNTDNQDGDHSDQNDNIESQKDREKSESEDDSGEVSAVAGTSDSMKGSKESPTSEDENSGSKGKTTMAINNVSNKGKSTMNEQSRPKFEYGKQKRGQVEIQNHKREENDNGKKKFGYNKNSNLWNKVKDHEFEWSDEFKARQRLTVFDRLMGGKKK